MATFHTGPLPLLTKGKTRFVFWPDQQWPHINPIGGMLDFLAYFKPHYLILGGDVINQDPFDHWAKNKPGKAKELPDPKPHYEQFNEEFMAPVRKAMGTRQIVFEKGNHEVWADRAIEMTSEGRGYWETENNVRGADLWVPQFQTVNLGKLHFAHGDMVNSGVNAAKKIMMVYHRNIWVGHHHKDESYTHVSPIDATEKLIARCIGCWTTLNPHYAKDKPNAWVNEFGYGFVDPDGNFSGYPVFAKQDGSFTALDGKEYADRG